MINYNLILNNLKKKGKKYNKLTEKDIEKCINYYGYILSKYLRLGYYITLSAYKHHKKERSIKFTPNFLKLVYRQTRKLFR